MRTTDGLRRALARLGQPDQLPWSPFGRSWGSLIPGTRSRSWPSGAARLRRAAAAWSKRYDPLLRHRAEGADGLGSLGYQTGTSEPPPDEHGPATCPEWLITKQASGLAMLCEVCYRALLSISVVEGLKPLTRRSAPPPRAGAPRPLQPLTAARARRARS